MNRIIITPTFRPHFPFNRDFLASYEEHSLDLGDVPVHFVVSRSELPTMQAMLEEFPLVPASAHAVEDLLAESGYEIEAGDLLKHVGKFAFQCLKKLYALKVLPYDQALILDSEALLLKPARVADAFDEYYDDPYVFFSDLGHRNARWYGELGDIVNSNGARLLGVPYPKMHLLEYYGWFYDKQLVEGMFAALPPDLLAAVRGLGREKHIFECVLYYTYLFNNPDRHTHRFVSVNSLLREYLGEVGYGDYLSNFTGHWEQVGIFEFVSKEVTERNLGDLLRLFREKNLRFYRSELINHNERVQEALIADSPITFLVSSENYRRIRERVALCVSGLPRDYRTNLKYLKDFIGDSAVDVFGHYWNTPDRDVIVRSLSPRNYEFEDVGTYASTHEAVARFHSAARANSLKAEHEAANGFTYDIVVSLSVDLLALDDLATVIDRIRAAQTGFESVVYVPATGQGSGLDGQLIIGGSSAMDAVARVGDKLGLRAAQGPLDYQHVLLRHVLEGGLSVQTFSLDYVALDSDEPLTLEGLSAQLAGQLARTSTAPAPPIPRTRLDEYWRVKSASVSLVTELGLASPRSFRISTHGGYLRQQGADVDTRAPRQDASSFVLVAAGDEDPSAVNIRSREFLVRSPDPGVAVNLHVDRRGEFRLDGLAYSSAAFLLHERDGGVALEWRPGFWRTPSSPDESPARLFVTVVGDRLSLCPPEGGDGEVGSTFKLEAVDDPEVEALPLGIRREVSTTQPTAANPFYSRWAWRVYTAARVFEEGGPERLVKDSKIFARKVVHSRSTRRGGPRRLPQLRARLRRSSR